MCMEERELQPEFTEEELNMLRTREPKGKSEELLRRLQHRVRMFLYTVFAVRGDNAGHWEEFYRSCYGKFDGKGNLEIDERDMKNISRYRKRVSTYLKNNDSAVFGEKIVKAVLADTEKKWNKGVFLKNYIPSKNATLASYVMNPVLEYRLPNLAKDEITASSEVMDVALSKFSNDEIKNRRYYADSPGTTLDGDNPELIAGLHATEKALDNFVLKEKYEPENPKKKRKYLFAGAELYPRCKPGHPHLEAVREKLRESISELDPSLGGIDRFLLNLHEECRTVGMEEMIRKILNGEIKKSFLTYLLYPIPEKTLDKTFPNLGMRQSYENHRPKDRNHPILSLVEGFDWFAENHLSMDWDEELQQRVPVRREEEKTEEKPKETLL